MGFNSTVVFNNDFLHRLKEDPDFSGKLYSDICGLHIIGRSSPYYQVIDSQHADHYSLVMIGGCTGKVLCGTFFGHRPPPEDAEEQMLKILADKLGYRLSKKKPKK